MQEPFNGKEKTKHAKDFVRRLDWTIPDINLVAGLRSLGQNFSDSSRLVYGMEAYKRGKLSKAVADIAAGGLTPLGKAIQAGTGDLKSVRGNMAVIIVSDGKETDKTGVNTAQAMKALYGDRVCIYTVLVGNDKAGGIKMERIAQAGACGYTTTVLARASSVAMVEFVTNVFLKKSPIKAPLPPRGPKDSDGDGVTDDLDKCPNTPGGAKVDERGCWSYEAVVLFDFDSYKLRSEALPLLVDPASILKKEPEIAIEIEGHTCNLGPDEYNQKLSENRANAVMEYFKSRGVAVDKMTVKGYGESKPAYPNDSKANRAKNRRVELRPLQ
jgi:OOP family OmpA-OmpF porin